MSERVENWNNARFRQKMANAVAPSTAANATAAGAISDAEERLWNRIEGRIGLEERLLTVERRAATSRWSKRSLFMCSASALAAAAIMLIIRPAPNVDVPNNITDHASPGTTLKGESAPPMIESLRLAVVDGAGKIERGHDGMHVAIGAAVVFEADVKGIDPSRGFDVDLSYAESGGPFEPIVRYHQLKKERELFTDNQGYVAFRPTRAGDFVFRLAPSSDGAAFSPPAARRDVTIHVE